MPRPSTPPIKAPILRPSHGWARQGPTIEGFLPYSAFVELRFGQWQAVLRRGEPPRAQLIAHVFWQYARGMALAALGRLQEAEAAQRAFLAESKGCRARHLSD